MAPRLLCAALLFLVTTATAFVCPPDFCEGVQCADLSAENCHGRISREGSACQCCDACITQLGLGQSCPEPALMGSPLTSECEPGLVCHPQEKVCIKPSP
ncbi:uncharacterized protein LOC144167044 [Haemaphysalis longicornis]